MDAVLKWSDQPRENQEPKDGHSETQQEAWLLGQPSLKKHLDYVKEKSIGGAQLANSQIVDEWRAANDYYAELEVREAGFCEQASISELDPISQPLADRVTADARWQRAFTDLPTSFAMVELDRLIVTQLFVNLNHTAGLTARLGSSPSPQSLFHFCFRWTGARRRYTCVVPVQVDTCSGRNLPISVFMKRLCSIQVRSRDTSLLARSAASSP
jgi:hypothetical protein